MSYLNGLVDFPSFFNLSLNLAIRSSRSEPQSAPGPGFAVQGFSMSSCKEYDQSYSVLTICLYSCVESCLVLLEEGVCYDQCILFAKLYQPLTFFIPYSKAKCACFSRCFLTSYFCIPVPYNEKDIFLGLVLKGLVGLYRTVQLQHLQHYWLGHGLGLP